MTEEHALHPVMEWVQSTSRKPTIAFDFDGTIIEHAFPAMGPLRPGIRDMMRELREAGAEIVIFTGRCSNAWPGYKEGGREKSKIIVEEFLTLNEVPFDRVDDGTHGKIPADVYYDDKAFLATNDLESDKKGLLNLLRL